MKHHSIPEPDPDLVVWRYMPLNRFENLINTKEIHLTRLDQFSDAHEGYIPASGGVPSFGEVAAQRHAWAWRHLIFASCWHIFPHENSLMWPSYGGSSGGVVIRSTAGKLADISTFLSNSYLAAINYGPWPNPIPPGGHWQLPIRKRPEFAAEAELRVIQEDIDLMMLDDFPQLGKAPPAHWPTFKRVSFEGLPLIDEIRCYPSAPSDFRDRVEALARAANIDSAVEVSSLTPEPIWFDPAS